eukprot:TRINITY_DN6136_c0_g1_i6.p1 TRINITY_DN6136_c0_g1~~TRINITY_DN6136_c0_g1_i6.p1  ORF type:complete len:300 (+),score=53.98 TRINITY_DN6136_c0_g1_i6:105-1004(+)
MCIRDRMEIDMHQELGENALQQVPLLDSISQRSLPPLVGHRTHSGSIRIYRLIVLLFLLLELAMDLRVQCDVIWNVAAVDVFQRGGPRSHASQQRFRHVLSRRDARAYAILRVELDVVLLEEITLLREQLGIVRLDGLDLREQAIVMIGLEIESVMQIILVVRSGEILEHFLVSVEIDRSLQHDVVLLIDDGLEWRTEISGSAAIDGADDRDQVAFRVDPRRVSLENEVCPPVVLVVEDLRMEDRVSAEDLLLKEGVAVVDCLFFLMIRRPPRSTQSRSSAASDVYKRQIIFCSLRSRT